MNTNKKQREKNRKTCSPAIWKKFNEVERDLWLEFYEEFLYTNSIPPKAEEKLTKEEVEVIAHNYACQAVWALQAICCSKHIAGIVGVPA